ncbi:MAG: hypothetical protein ABI221_03925 [Candidatus Saccharimonadales bacterium]
MSLKLQSFFSGLLKDKKGRVVIWQAPNLPIWGWAIFTALGLLLKHGQWHTGSQNLAQLWLFTWAYLELKSGDSPFRRILGAIFMAHIILALFT